MKNHLAISGLILMLTGLASSCGKKAHETPPLRHEEFVATTVVTPHEENRRDIQDAIIAEKPDRIKELLEDKTAVNLNATLPDGETLLTTAVIKNDLTVVDLLIAKKASLSSPNENLDTPLMIACKLGNLEMVEHLLSFGASLNQVNSGGFTALQLAIQNSHKDIAILLLNKDADYTVTNKRGETAQKLAENKGEDFVEVVDLINAKSFKDGKYPTDLKVRTVLTIGSLDLLKTLTTKFPGILSVYSDLNPYVIVIQKRNHDLALSMVQLMFEKKANLQGSARSNLTPLNEAIKKDYVDMVEWMLTKDIDPDVQDENGISPLGLAVRKNSLPMVKALLKKNAQQRYTYYDASKRRIVGTACADAKMTRFQLETYKELEMNTEIMSRLGCGFRRLF